MLRSNDILLPALLAFVAAGCMTEPDPVPYEGPHSIRVALHDGARTGCEGEPLPYSSAWVELTLDLEILDAQGRPYADFDGVVEVKMNPGEVLDSSLELDEGRLEGALVRVRRGYGKDVRVWVDAELEDGRFLAGAGPKLCFASPTVREIQEHDSSYHSPLENQGVYVKDGVLMANGISQKGFFMDDLSLCTEKEGWEGPEDGSRIDCTYGRQARVYRKTSLLNEFHVEIVLPGVYDIEQVVVTCDDESKCRAPRYQVERPGSDAQAADPLPEGLQPASRDQAAFAGRRADAEVKGAAHTTIESPPAPGVDYYWEMHGSTLHVWRNPEGRIPHGTVVKISVDYREHALAFSTLYVFTFSAPFGVEAGTRVCSAQGGVVEYLGLTEIGFPSYRVFMEGGAEAAAAIRPYNDEQVPDPRDDESFIFLECELERPDWMGEEYVPDPVVIPAADLRGAEIPVYEESHMALDAFESALVELHNVRMPAFWKDCDYDGSRQVDRCWDQDRIAGRCKENEVAENDCEMACATEGVVGLTAGERAEYYAGCAEETNFYAYGQFTVTATDYGPDGEVLATGRININTQQNVPEFDPYRALLYPNTDKERKVKGFKAIRGTLFQVDSARPVWMITPRSLADIDFDFVE